MDVSKAIIIITGAGSGFGKEMALSFARQGAVIFALDIDKLSLNKLCEGYPSIHPFLCDVTKNESVEDIIGYLFSKKPLPNVLINNAGIMRNSPLVNILKRPDSRHSLELWNEVINVNQNSVFYLSRSFANQMIKLRNKGLIINISSIAAKGNIGQTAYAASKAAIEAMTKVWAKELGAFGIRSIAIAPGFMDSAGTHHALEEKMLAQWIEKTPLKRTGTIEEVISTVRFAIENDFLNGEVISVNGGLVL